MGFLCTICLKFSCTCDFSDIFSYCVTESKVYDIHYFSGLPATQEVVIEEYEAISSSMCYSIQQC